MNLNNQIFFSLYNLANKDFYFDKVVVFTAHILPYMAIVLAMFFLLLHHDVINSKNPFKVFLQKWKEIVLVFFSGIFAWCIATLIKIIVKAPRPFVEFSQVNPLLEKSDFSFPSGHATFYMALATALFFSHKKIGYLFIFFALLIGIARIISGVHFPIDIFSGFILGILISYLVKYFYNKINK